MYRSMLYSDIKDRWLWKDSNEYFRQIHLRVLALEISLASFGSSQIFFLPHSKMDEASRFCTRSELIERNSSINKFDKKSFWNTKLTKRLRICFISLIVLQVLCGADNYFKTSFIHKDKRTVLPTFSTRFCDEPSPAARKS